MTSGRNVKFGAFIRREREEREIGLREMAKKSASVQHISRKSSGMRFRRRPRTSGFSYLSKVERDEIPPAAEDKVRRIAEIFDIDVDELLALAGKVSSDLTEIIRERPRELAALLRTTRGMTADYVARLAHEAEKPKDE